MGDIALRGVFRESGGQKLVLKTCQGGDFVEELRKPWVRLKDIFKLKPNKN